MLDILLTFLYYAFVSWMVIATYVNYVLKPYRSRTGFSISGVVSITYAVLWALVFTLPVAYQTVFGG